MMFSLPVRSDGGIINSMFPSIQEAKTMCFFSIEGREPLQWIKTDDIGKM